MLKYNDIPTSRIDTFLTKHDNINGCHVYKGYLDRDGYGNYLINRKRYRAHQVAWVIDNQQDWPLGKIARHTCHNPSCVNPMHIIPGTQKENIDDCIKAGRHRNPWTKNPKTFEKEMI